MDSILIIIVDDDESIRKSFSRLIALTEFKPVAFENTRECMVYLEGQSGRDMPLGYLVDMHIVGDQDGPEQLHDFLKERDMLRNFYFMTGDLTFRNQQVLKRTGIDVLMKDNYELFDVINKMCSMSRKD